MIEVTLKPVSVMSDGGSHEGRLVFAQEQLVAVFAQVSADETAGSRSGRAGGWFLEAGFGPCSILMSVQPPVFATLDEATDWVRWKLETRLSS